MGGLREKMKKLSRSSSIIISLIYEQKNTLMFLNYEFLVYFYGISRGISFAMFGCISFCGISVNDNNSQTHQQERS